MIGLSELRRLQQSCHATVKEHQNYIYSFEFHGKSFRI